MNILVITPNPIDTTSYYRAWGVLPNLARKMGNVNLISDKGRTMTWVDINQMDLIFMHRPFTIEQLKFAQYAKEMHIPLWVDYDDDLTSIPQWMSFFNLYMTQQTQEIIAALITMADAVTVSTQALADRISTYNQKIFVIPNALNDDIMNGDITFSDNKIAMWRGSETHHVDLMEFTTAISKCVTRDDWEWLYFGFNPWFLPKTRHIPVMDPVMYFRTMKSIAPGVMFVPLVDDTFNRCKSNINWIESTVAGAVTLVPEWDSWAQPGSFKYADKKEFSEQLKHLMSAESIFVRRDSHRKSVEYIRENLLLSKVNEQRQVIIESLVK